MLTPACFRDILSIMRKQSVSVGLICIALFAPLVLPAQQSASTSLTVRVSDQTGAGVAHAQIRLLPTPDKAPAKLETDDQGRFSISLKPGGYALLVSAQGFKEGSQCIDVGANQGQTSQVVGVVLKVGDVSSPIPIYSRDSLVLSAEPERAPVVLSPAEFRALPHVTITVHNGHSNADETYSGVALATLLAKVNAPLGQELHKEALTRFLVASGSDGYSVVLSLAEVDPSFHGGQVLVADTRDGQPLAKSGPFQLIVSEDKRPARWVHNLVAISLQSAR